MGIVALFCCCGCVCGCVCVDRDSIEDKDKTILLVMVAVTVVPTLLWWLPLTATWHSNGDAGAPALPRTCDSACNRVQADGSISLPRVRRAPLQPCTLHYPSP